MGQDEKNKKVDHKDDLKSLNQPIKMKNSQDPWKFLNCVMPTISR